MLRVPLNADTEGMTFKLQRLGNAIGADSRHLQSSANLVCGLVMQTVCFDFRSLQNLVQFGSGGQMNTVAAGTTAAEIRMSGDILVQGSTLEDVQHLYTPADAQNGLFGGEIGL